MKRGMNRNGRKKEARAIFLIMKTLLCVSFCFVVRGRYSNRALSYPPSTPSAPPPSSCAPTLPPPPPPTSLPLIFFFYIITCGLSRAALMGQGRRQGCRQGAGQRGCQGEIALVMNYIARGYVSLSEEHQRSRSPRVCAQFFLFLPLSLALFLHFSPVFLIFAKLVQLFDGELFLSMVTARVRSRALQQSGSLRQVIICHDYFILRPLSSRYFLVCRVSPRHDNFRQKKGSLLSIVHSKYSQYYCTCD